MCTEPKPALGWSVARLSIAQCSTLVLADKSGKVSKIEQTNCPEGYYTRAEVEDSKGNVARTCFGGTDRKASFGWFCQLGLAPFDRLIWPHLSY